MNRKIEAVFSRTLELCAGFGGGPALGGASHENPKTGTLAGQISGFLRSAVEGRPDYSLLPEQEKLGDFAREASAAFAGYYADEQNYRRAVDDIECLFNSGDQLELAQAVSRIWCPELLIDDVEIFDSWKLSGVKPNPAPYNPSDIIIQLNALYSPAGETVPAEVDEKTAASYRRFIEDSPERIAVYDHPVPVFTRGDQHELEKCLVELDHDIAFEKESGIFPENDRLKVLISISTTHRGLDEVCEYWLQSVLSELGVKHLCCYLLSENKARRLEELIGGKADIFTVQGKYACHFGALKYAQLIFGKAFGTRAGFKLDTDEGIHSEDMQKVSGKTWLEQLCHPYWGGSGINSDGRRISIGFNIGEYVDSRDLDSLGYNEAIRTPEVKPKKDLRGTYLLFNKGVCQAKGTMLLNRTRRLEDFISHPLVKGGGYGIDNDGLRTAVPVGFSMVGRAEDQQFYYSAAGAGVQGIFNPMLRIIHYKAAVAKSEHRSKVGTSIADIYRMLLFRELMSGLRVIEKTTPFPANYASPLSKAQAFFLWLWLVFTESAAGNEETAQEYLNEGINELLPLLAEIKAGRIMEKFESEKEAWREFIEAVDSMAQADAAGWLESLKLN